jgi:hypothetical protein
MADYTNTTLVRNESSVAVSGQACQADADLAPASKGDRLVVRMSNPEAGTLTCVFGTGATGILASQGTVTASVATGTVEYIILETARVAKATGDINVTCALSSGTLENCKLETIIVPV